MDALLWTLVLCCAAVAAVSATCSDTEFPCQRRNGGSCLPLRWVCDRDNDCLDHSDERECGSIRICPEGFFACESGRCIPDYWVCDGANDCRDSGTDEQNCGTAESTTDYERANSSSCAVDQFACTGYRAPGGCLPLQFACDGDTSDCTDHSDELNCGTPRECPYSWHACASGRCVPPSYVCDGGDDCPDGSDESQCESHRSCPEGEFACTSNRRASGCIPMRWVCDGDRSDCVDGSDESQCGSPRACPEDHFSCDSGRCIPDNWLCDGTNDCHDSGSDERNCHTSTEQPPATVIGNHCAPDEFACRSNRRSSGCIPLRWVCDGDHGDCIDGSDEQNCGLPRPCPAGHFSCDNGRCIPNSWECDGANDCHDSGSDERNCNTGPTTAASTVHCSSDQFACRSPRRSSGCIPRSWVCDGDHGDCYDGSDEQNCPAHTCASDEFACRSPRQSSGCIPLRWVCDGDTNDCYDGSDEQNCGSTRSCPADHFACDNGRCIPNSWKCDGTNDCHDSSGTDEQNCQQCTGDQFACRSPRRSNGCIPRSWVCDGDHGDCYDGSDERNCGLNTTPAPTGHCSSSEFACRSRRRSNGCIPRSWVCDGDHSDCYDDSDEQNCGTSRTSTPSTTEVSPANCPVGQFACRSPRRDSGCIPKSWVCDGDHGDCYDNSDEVHCGQRGCAADEFACISNRRSDGCIPRSWVCDGDHRDCVDDSDERQCGTGSTSTTTQASTVHCSGDQFACNSPRRSSGCIPRSWVCDGDHGDCFDGSDEQNCTRHCAENEFACTSNRRDNGCIPRSWVCDGDHRDCVDDSDEQNCGFSSSTEAPTVHCSGDQFACRSPRRDSGCIPRSWVCDGDHGDCYDGSDERNCATQRPCTENEFACTSNRRSNGCIPRSWVCDGDHRDCVDDSDEQNCGHSTSTEISIVQHHCAPDEFACSSPRRSSGCIPRSWVCDGDRHDCYDHSDEQNCDQHRCAADEFACRSNRRSNGCIPRTWVCDGDHSDCIDGSDEQNCAAHTCAADEFACRSPRRANGCIPRSWVCDGDNSDCIDGSDEQNCAAHTCSSDEFACRSPRRANGCIPMSWVCDGDHRDCYDNSDELNCGANTEPTPWSVTPTTAQNHCPSDEFACRSPRRSSGCIPRRWVCDGDRGDCYDGSDEQNCPGQGQCASHEFACTSNRRSNGCIPRSWVCDGDHRDCVDDSDEQNCGGNTQSTPSSVTTTTAYPATCSAEQFACVSRRWRGGCIPRAAVCDGRPGDCDDGSDERQCNNPVTPTASTVVPQTPAQGGAVKVELPSWLATDQDAHFALSLAPMLRARSTRDKLDAQMAVLRLFRDLARN